jgi:hypothetical protein
MPGMMQQETVLVRIQGRAPLPERPRKRPLRPTTRAMQAVMRWIAHSAPEEIELLKMFLSTDGAVRRPLSPTPAAALPHRVSAHPRPLAA